MPNKKKPIKRRAPAQPDMKKAMSNNGMVMTMNLTNMKPKKRQMFS